MNRMVLMRMRFLAWLRTDATELMFNEVSWWKML